MLFVVIHQTYELWFKQILWELDSVRVRPARTADAAVRARCMTRACGHTHAHAHAHAHARVALRTDWA